MPLPLTRYLPTEATRAGSTGGGEYAAPCPRCGGEDRFRVWPAEGESGRFWCRKCEWSGDGIALLRSDECGGLTFAEACRTLGTEHKLARHANKPQRRTRGVQSRVAQGDGGGSNALPRSNREVRTARALQRFFRPPGDAWQRPARAFVEACRRALWEDTGAAASARRYLTGRGFTERAIRAAGLGLNAEERRPLRTAWGLSAREGKREGGRVWLPRGIVIPWWESGEPGAPLWKVNIRRLPGEAKKQGGGPKYVQAAGKKPAAAGEDSEERAPAWSTNALYGASALRPGRPAVLVEGELDALAIMQEARATGRPFGAGGAPGPPLVAAVATGSTGGARHVRWVAKLATCHPVLIAFDAEKQSEGAVAHWQNLFPAARRHAPEGAKDAAAMLETGADVRAWIERGLRKAPLVTEEAQAA